MTYQVFPQSDYKISISPISQSAESYFHKDTIKLSDTFVILTIYSIIILNIFYLCRKYMFI